MSKDETQDCEVKQSLGEWKEVVESVAAFATSQGGCVRIGIGPDGRRVGVQIGKGSVEDLANKIKSSTDPPQYPEIDIHGVEGSSVITVTVQESPIKPVWAFGRPLKRVGRTNQRLSPEETRRLMEGTTGRTWDALPCVGFGLGDVSREAVGDFLRRAGQDAGTSNEQVIENLSLATPEGFANATVLLFGRNPQRFFTDAQVKCARFKGVTPVHFLDERTFDGVALSQLDSALAFVERNTQQAIVITGKAERDIVPEYPAEAIREAVTNAICHRDYAVAGTVQVRIFDDRLEVWNPGTLPPDMSIDSLYQSHPSRPRNRKLAAAFYRARLIEQWGTGTLRIVEACKSQGLPRPEFLSDMGTFIVRFTKPVMQPEFQDARLNERQRKALEYVREHGSIRTHQYGEEFSIGERQAREDLSELAKLGLLGKEGSGRSTHYVLPEPTRMPD